MADGSRVLREAGKTFARNAEHDDVLNQLVAMVAELTGATSVVLMLQDDETDEYRAVARTGEAAEKVHDEVARPGEGMAGHTVTSGRTQGSRRLHCLSLPLVFGAEVVGVLTVTGPGMPSPPADVLEDLEALAGQAALVVEVRACHQNTSESYRGMVVTFAEAVEARDPYTLGHSKAVRDYAVGIGSKLGMDSAALSRLELAGLLHDIGKLTVSDTVLKKESFLTEAEMQTIRTHSVMGARLLQPVRYFADIIPCIKHHHERYDGSGYPDGLVGEDIPYDARILAIADAFDAMSSKRVYREFLSTDKILLQLRKGKGRQFDPKILEAFLEAFEIDRRTYRAGPARLSEVIHEKHFDYYALAVRDSVEHAKQTVALMAQAVELLLSRVSTYAGPVVTARIEKKMNAYSIENGLDFILVDGRMKTHMLVPVSLVEVVKRFQAYVDYLARSIADSLGSSVGEMVIKQINGQLDPDGRLLLEQALGASRFWQEAA